MKYILPIIDRNEGLRSRIAFHLGFPDYSPQEHIFTRKKKPENGIRRCEVKSCMPRATKKC